jgi:hypothetical protein
VKNGIKVDKLEVEEWRMDIMNLKDGKKISKMKMRGIM